MSFLILHGRRLVELQKWRSLRVSVSPFQNASAFSSSFSSARASFLSPKDGQSFTVSYLVASLGLTKKLAQSISRKVSFENKHNPDSVLSLLKSHGFTGSQISSIITDYPQLLLLDAEKSLGIKLQFLQSRGASRSELTETVSTVPKILGMKEGKSLSRYYDIVKEIIKAGKGSKFEKLCQSLPQGSKQENKIRNVLVLRELGVPQRLLFPLLISEGGPVNGKEKFEESLKKVVEMGFDPSTSKFVDALSIIQGLSDKTIEEKLNDYKRLGFSVEDVWAMFKKFPMFLGLSEKRIANSIETFVGLGFTRDEVAVMVKRFPSCLNLSAESVKKKTEFVVKKMNLPLKTLVSNPQVLALSMEKRIVPRCNIIKALKSEGLLGTKPPSLEYALKMTDHDFLSRYVRKHGDKELVAELMAIFTRAGVS